MASLSSALHTADWRHRVFALYRQVRALAADSGPSIAHEHWRAERDELFRTHPASPLDDRAKARFAGLNVAPYNPDLRFEAVVDEAMVSEPLVAGDDASERMEVPTGTDGVVPFERIGTVQLDGVGTLDLWRLASYGGGLFLPLRDGSAGEPGGTYGGGRYLLDTVKGAHLGAGGSSNTSDSSKSLIVDVNFAYNPSCAYDESWACPLPGPGNRLEAPLPYGELTGAY